MTRSPSENLAPQQAAIQATQPVSQIRQHRLQAVDALRGIACLGVLLHHLSTSPWSSGLFQGHDLPTRAVRWFAGWGWLGVDLFLVLSGFCLFYPLVRRHTNARSVSLDLPRFFVRRAWRILPPYYVALVLPLVFAPHPAAFGPVFGSASTTSSVLAHLFLVHNLHPATIGTINPSLWSLALEAQLYLAFPALVWLGRRGGMRAVLGTTLAVSVLWQIGAYLVIGLHPAHWEVGGAVFHALPSRCFEFAAGMGAAALVARPARPGQAGWALTIALMGAVIGLRMAAISRFGPHGEPAWAVAFAGLLVASCRLLPHTWFERRAPLALLSGLGVISYSVYLLHQWLIGIAYGTVPLIGPEGAAFPVRVVLGLAAIGSLVGAGYVLFVLVERPTLLLVLGRRETDSPPQQ